MAIWVHSDVQDNGLNEIKNNCNKLALISGYTANDSYATVNAAILAEATMASTDFTLSGAAGATRTLTTASGKQDSSANASNTTGQGGNNHFAFLNTAASKVLWITEETSNQDIFSGNQVNFPSLSLNSPQPIAV